MMAEYTPTTTEILASYVIGEHLTNSAFPVKETEACFRNWLAAHDEQVRAAAAQEAHNAAADVMTRRKIKPFDGLAVLAAIDGLSEERENG
jgi:hypothetical protein